MVLLVKVVFEECSAESVELCSGSFFISDGADSTRRAARRRERACLFCIFHARFPQAHGLLSAARRDLALISPLFWSSRRSQSNCGSDLSSSTAPILRSAPLGGESERTFFAFFKPGCRKHTLLRASGKAGHTTRHIQEDVLGQFEDAHGNRA